MVLAHKPYWTVKANNTLKYLLPFSGTCSLGTMILGSAPPERALFSHPPHQWPVVLHHIENTGFSLRETRVFLDVHRGFS